MRCRYSAVSSRYSAWRSRLQFTERCGPVIGGAVPLHCGAIPLQPSEGLVLYWLQQRAFLAGGGGGQASASFSITRRAVDCLLPAELPYIQNKKPT